MEITAVTVGILKIKYYLYHRKTRPEIHRWESGSQ